MIPLTSSQDTAKHCPDSMSSWLLRDARQSAECWSHIGALPGLPKEGKTPSPSSLAKTAAGACFRKRSTVLSAQTPIIGQVGWLDAYARAALGDVLDALSLRVRVWNGGVLT